MTSILSSIYNTLGSIYNITGLNSEYDNIRDWAPTFIHSLLQKGDPIANFFHDFTDFRPAPSDRVLYVVNHTVLGLDTSIV
jgi:hypothetical protein